MPVTTIEAGTSGKHALVVDHDILVVSKKEMPVRLKLSAEISKDIAAHQIFKMRDARNT